MSNLVTRTISGTFFLAILITSLLWRAEAFGIVFLFIVIVMMKEYLRISLNGRYRIPAMLSVLSGAMLFCLSFAISCYGISAEWLVLVPVTILLIPVTVLLEHHQKEYQFSPFLWCSILYIALPFSMTPLICFGQDADSSFNAIPLLAILIMLWCSDIGAYVFGLSLGKFFSRKLCPEISPKKTWIGYYGGLAAALLSGFLISESGMVNYGTFHTMMIALTVNLAGTFGDLAESQFKRHFSVKDSGTIMPGHGGLLDRFDGALLAFPAAISYILLLNP